MVSKRHCRGQYSPLFESTAGVGSGFDPLTADAASKVAMIAAFRFCLVGEVVCGFYAR